MNDVSAALGLEAAFLQIASCDPAALRSRVRELLELAMLAFGASGAILEEPDGDDLVYAVASRAFVDREGFRLPRAGSLSGLAVQSGALQYCADAELDRRVDRAACQALGLRSMVCSPLQGGARNLVLKFMTPAPHAFGPAQLRQIELFSEELGRTLADRRTGAADSLRPALPARPHAATVVRASQPERVVVSSRHLLGAIERAGLLGSWTLDPANLDMQWSEGLHRLLGAESRDGPPRLDDLLRWTHPSDQSALHKLLTNEEGWAEPVCARLRGPSGGLRWIRFHRELHVPAERLHIGVAQDVSALQTATTALKRYHGAFEALAKLMGGMIWRADAGGSLSFELGWCAYTGTTLAQNQGDGWIDQLHPEDRAAAAQAWRQACAARTPFAARYRVRRHDGAWELFDSRALAPPNDEGAEWLGVTLPVGKDALDAPSAEGESRPLPRELKAMRALADWTVEDLAAKSGVSASTITRYERGDPGTAPTRPANLDRLAEALAARGIRVVDQGGRRSITQAPPSGA